MAYQLNLNVAHLEDLVELLHTFAVADGWTSVFNNLVTGTPDERHIGIYKGTCQVAIGFNASETAISRSPSGTDGFLCGAIATSLNSGSTERFWSQPGSLVTAYNDNDRVICNDLGEGPWSKVWFFSEDSGPAYIHVVVQSAGDRYSHFSFGELDEVGYTVDRGAFCASVYHAWWPVNAISNDPADNGHEIGYLCGTNNTEANVFVPQNAVPSGGSWPTPPAQGEVFLANRITEVMTRVNNASGHETAGQIGKILDFFMAVDNQLVTGGTVLLPLMWNFQDGDGDNHFHLGNVPGIRLADISGSTPEDILEFGSDEWVIFPWKRVGTEAELYQGPEESLSANTLKYAWAYKKNV